MKKKNADPKIHLRRNRRKFPYFEQIKDAHQIKSSILPANLQKNMTRNIIGVQLAPLPLPHVPVSLGKTGKKNIPTTVAHIRGRQYSYYRNPTDAIITLLKTNNRKRPPSYFTFLASQCHSVSNSTFTPTKPPKLQLIQTNSLLTS